MTVEVNGSNVSYSYADGYSFDKISAACVGAYVDIHLNTAGEIDEGAGVTAIGAVTAISDSGVTLDSGKVWPYADDYANTRLQSGAVGSDARLSLSSAGEITYADLSYGGTVTAANPSAGTITVEGRSFSYETDFSEGAMLTAESVGQHIYLELNANGKIRLYTLYAYENGGGNSSEGGNESFESASVDFVNRGENGDYVTIRSITPLNPGPGATASFRVMLDYELVSYDGGVVQLGFNTDNEAEYRIYSEAPVSKGSGHVTLTANITTPADWGTVVYANLAEADHTESYEPLASTGRALGGEMLLFGDALLIDDGGTYMLTPYVTPSLGSVWFAEPYETSDSLAVTFDYQANPAASVVPGDGMALVFSDEPGLSTDEDLIAGGDFLFQGLFGVELDTFLNSWYNDPSASHVAVIRDFVDTHVVSVDDGHIADGEWHTLMAI